MNCSLKMDMKWFIVESVCLYPILIICSEIQGNKFCFCFVFCLIGRCLKQFCRGWMKKQHDQGLLEIVPISCVCSDLETLMNNKLECLLIIFLNTMGARTSSSSSAL